MLTLLAVLLTAGWQSVEAGHFHAADEIAAECLLCKGQADTLTPISDAVPSVFAVAGNPQTWESEPQLPLPCIHYSTRGPPHHS